MNKLVLKKPFSWMVFNLLFLSSPSDKSIRHRIEIFPCRPPAKVDFGELWKHNETSLQRWVLVLFENWLFSQINANFMIQVMNDDLSPVWNKGWEDGWSFCETKKSSQSREQREGKSWQCPWPNRRRFQNLQTGQWQLFRATHQLSLDNQGLHRTSFAKSFSSVGKIYRNLDSF